MWKKKELILINRNKLNNFIFNCLPIAGILLFTITLNLHVFPLTEGWWETYAWLSSYQRMYIDFNLALPPLYTLLIKAIMSYSDNLIFIRMILLTIYLLNLYFIYIFLGYISNRTYAIIGVFISQSLLILNNPVWLSKDYHTLVSLLVTICSIFTYKYLNTKNKISELKYIFILGIISGLITLTSKILL